MIDSMSNVKNSLLELVGNTPMLRPRRFQDTYKINNAKLLVKLECFNPAGSVKDRAAIYMIEDAKRSGALQPGATIIEATSGNTGIGIAAVARVMGYKTILTMPKTMSEERRKLLKSYGAEIVLTDGSKGMQGAIDMANLLHKQIDGSVILGQFENAANPRAHFETTGPEIWRDSEGEVDIFVSAVGTGGTFSGVGGYLKTKNPRIKNIAVEPHSSPVISKGKSGAHKIQGIGAGFIPDTLNLDICDAVITVKDEEAYAYARAFADSEGVLVGISSGAALCAAHKLTMMEENNGKTIVAVLPDSGERYLSTDLYD